MNSRCKGLEVREGTVSLGNCKLCNEVEGLWFRVWWMVGGKEGNEVV